MTKTVIIMDTICNLFNKILEKLVLCQDYDIIQFNEDYQNAINQSLQIIRYQKKDYVKQELTDVLNRQVYNILAEVVYYKYDKDEFWIKV